MAGFAQQASSVGSTIPGYAVPPAPESRIRDEAGLLDARPAVSARISARLKNLEVEHGLPTYVVIYSSLVRGDVAQLPRELYDAWIGENNEGIVVVCEIDERKMEMAFPINGDGNPLAADGTPTRLPDYRLIPVIKAINAEVAGATGQVDYLDRMTATLALELDRVLTPEEDQSHTGRFIAVTLVLGGVIGLLGFFGHRYASRHEEKTHEQFLFPEVEVEARLGAPFGGARVNTLSYELSRNAEGTEQP